MCVVYHSPLAFDLGVALLGRVAVVEFAEERSTRHHISYSRFGKLLLGLRISCAFFSDIYIIACMFLGKEICCG